MVHSAEVTPPFCERAYVDVVIITCFIFCKILIYFQYTCICNASMANSERNVAKCTVSKMIPKL